MREKKQEQRSGQPPPVQIEGAFVVGQPTSANNVVHSIMKDQPPPNGIAMEIPETPKSLKRALNGPNADLWEQAALLEAKKLVDYDALDANPQAVREALAAGAQIVPIVNACRVKLDQFGNFLKVKVRSCAAGNQESYNGLRNASSSVVDHAALALVRAWGVHRGCTPVEGDVVSAYLNATENQPRVVRVTPEFMERLIKAGLKVTSNSLLLVVRKCLYGYDDAGKQYMKLTVKIMKNVGFTQCEDDPCIFKIEQQNKIVVTCIYVDDFFWIHNDDGFFNHVCSKIQQFYEFGHIRNTQHFLGTGVTKTNNGFQLDNEPLIKAATEMVGVTNANPKHTPWPSGAEITNDAPIPEEVNRYAWGYRNVLGIASYIAQRTRFDILIHMSLLASKQSNPNNNDYILLKNVVKYLNTTKRLRLAIERPEQQSRGGTSLLNAPLKIVAQCDSDYANCPLTRRSVSGMFFTLNHANDNEAPFTTGIPITASAKRQTTVSTSVNEAELKAATIAAKQLVFLHSILKFIDPTAETPSLHSDSAGAIAIANGTGKRRRSKHIDVRHFYVRELVSSNQIHLHHVGTNDNVSDAMTKPLGRIKFLDFRQKLNIIDPDNRH
jgi:hypothetical protein